MQAADRKALITLPIVVLIGALLALAGSQGGYAVSGIGVFSIAVATAFAIQWVAFVGAALGRTERFFDLTGSITYVAVTGLTLALSPAHDVRSFVLAAMVAVWATRLGSFLFGRISKNGGDDRFDEIKRSLPRFLNVWTIQGLWVSFTAAAAWMAITSQTRVPFGWLGVVGVVVWLAGFALEVVADVQKSRFRANPANKGEFISIGVWSWSRHPNYFGEATLWWGLFFIGLGSPLGLYGVISPLAIAFLLLKVSGIPMLEAKYQGNPEFAAYKARTNSFFPWFPREFRL